MRRTWPPLFLCLASLGAAVAGGALAADTQGQEIIRLSSPAPRPGYDAIRHREIVRDTWVAYHETIAALGITAEQRVQLFGLLVERSEAGFDAHTASISLGATNDNQVSKSVLDAYATLSSEIGELIGDDGLRELDRAAARAGVRQMLHGTVVADLAIAGEPLTRGQETAIANIYADAKIHSGGGKAAPGSNNPPPVGGPSDVARSDQEILDRASAVLSSGQMRALKDSQAASEKEAIFMDRWRSSRLGASLFRTAPDDSQAAAASSPNSENDEVSKPDPEEELIRFRAILRNEWVNFHEIIDGLDLTRENQAKVLRILAAREEALRDAREAVRTAGLTQPADINRSQFDAFSSMTSELRSLIGEAGVQALDHGQVFSSMLQEIRDTVGIDMAMAGAPLSPDQEAKLARIKQDLADAPMRLTRGQGGVLIVEDPVGSPQFDQKILERASAVLSPAQVAALRQSLVTSERETTLELGGNANEGP